MGILSIAPPLLAILLAIWTKEVFGSLLAGIALGALILESGNPFGMFTSTLSHLVGVFSDAGNVRVVIFCSLMGSLIALVQRSGGVQGFVEWAGSSGWVRSRRSAMALTTLVGIVIFIESNITCLVTGAIGRPLFDHYKISREKLSLICDSTSAPICMMFPFNAWGALILGLLATQGVTEPAGVLIRAVPLSFYLFAAVLVLIVALFTNRDFAGMRRAEHRVFHEGKVLRDGARPLVDEEIVALKSKPGLRPRPARLLVPIFGMVAMIPVSLLVTGNGDLTKGSGSTAVLWGVSVGVIASIALSYRALGGREISELVIKGMAALVPLNVLVIMALAIGTIANELGTGRYVAQVFSSALPAFLIPVVVFLVSCGVSFATGSSWGTFAIMMPVAIGSANTLGLPVPLMVSAVLSGGVFGDHSSVLSDTTIVAAMSSSADLIDHFETQLPYALTAMGLTVIWYLGAGLLAA